MMNYFKYSTGSFLALVAVLVCGCGINLFGPGETAVLEMYAQLGKDMAKPQAINDEQNSEDMAQQVVSEGSSAAKRLAKSATNASASRSWVDSCGVTKKSNSFIYWEVVTDKPAQDDPQKKMTGIARVRFFYSGVDPDGSPSRLQPAAITRIYSYSFVGTEYKTWSGETDSIRVRVVFSTSGDESATPGYTTWWAKNITTGSAQYGDTAYFTLDSLDESAHIQYGGGYFYDADAENRSEQNFNFEIAVLHKNNSGTNPYARYEDNEGIMSFYLPWVNHPDDSLYFRIHFYPKYARAGAIYKNGPDGTKLVYFEKNEKTGDGHFVLYNAEGDTVRRNDSF